MNRLGISLKMLYFKDQLYGTNASQVVTGSEIGWQGMMIQICKYLTYTKNLDILLLKFILLDVSQQGKCRFKIGGKFIN